MPLARRKPTPKAPVTFVEGHIVAPKAQPVNKYTERRGGAGKSTCTFVDYGLNPKGWEIF